MVPERDMNARNALLRTPPLALAALLTGLSVLLLVSLGGSPTTTLGAALGFAVAYLGWLYLITTRLSESDGAGPERRKSWLKLVILLALALLAVAWLVSLLSARTVLPTSVGSSLIMVAIPVLTLVLLMAMFEASRTLRSTELGRQATSGEYVTTFAMLWLLSVPVAIGPALVQSRVRRLLYRAKGSGSRLT